MELCARIAGLIVLLLLAIAATSIAFRQTGSGSGAEFFNGVDDGQLPDDAESFFRQYYEAVEEESGKIEIPVLEQRPDYTMTLQLSDGEELSLQELYERCAPTIVSISAYKGDSMGYSWGSGVIIDSNGLILTNFHVLADTDRAVITLSGVTITNEDSGNVLLSVCDDGWSGGSNIATLNASGQTLEGAVLVGSNSTLTMNLSDSSAFTGYISGNITNASGTSVSTDVGTVSVTLDGTSTWTLTADSYVTSFSGDASNVISNGYTLYVNGTALTGTK